MNSMWWPPYRSIGGMIHQAIFLILSALSAFNYMMATTTGPGYLPYKWEPKVCTTPYDVFINLFFNNSILFFFICLL